MTEISAFNEMILPCIYFFHSEWVVVVWLQVDNFTALSWREHVTLLWDYICFVPDQHAELELYSPSSIERIVETELSFVCKYSHQQM